MFHRPPPVIFIEGFKDPFDEMAPSDLDGPGLGGDQAVAPAECPPIGKAVGVLCGLALGFFGARWALAV